MTAGVGLAGALATVGRAFKLVSMSRAKAGSGTDCGKDAGCCAAQYVLRIQSIIRFFHRAIRLPLEHAPGGKDSEKPPSPDRLADRGVRRIAVQSAQA